MKTYAHQQVLGSQKQEDVWSLLTQVCRQKFLYCQQLPNKQTEAYTNYKCSLLGLLLATAYILN